MKNNYSIVGIELKIELYEKSLWLGLYFSKVINAVKI